MKKLLLVLFFILTIPNTLFSQATPSSKLLFDQIGPSLIEVNSYTYKYYPDGNSVGTNLVVTCTGTTSPFICSAAFPAFTPGSHNLTLTASNTAGESAKSSPFAFVFVVIPAVPSNIRIG